MENLPKIITWKDSVPSGSVGWLIIDSLKNGICSGGLFMHENATLSEVQDLAATMTLKNALQDPLIGGAKAGICFDHQHPDANNVLRRFLIAQKYYINKYWSTGSDLNTKNTLIHHIIKEDLNLTSGFHSAFNAFGKSFNEDNNFLELIARPLNKYFTISEYATGFSLAKCISEVCKKDMRVLIQGWGTVGSSLGHCLYKENIGVVVGIVEKDYFIHSEAGIDVNMLLSSWLIQDDKEKMLEELSEYGYKIIRRQSMIDTEEFLANCLSSSHFDVFCPCAVRYSITKKIIAILNKVVYQKKLYGNFWIISGANNVFSPMINIQDVLDNGINVLPEWLSNCGNTILYNELIKLGNREKHVADKILSTISRRIKSFISLATYLSKDTNFSLYEACFVLIKKIIDGTYSLKWMDRWAI